MFRLETGNDGEVFVFDDQEGDAIRRALKKARADMLEKAAQRLEEYWTRHRGCQCAAPIRRLKDEGDG